MEWTRELHMPPRNSGGGYAGHFVMSTIHAKLHMPTRRNIQVCMQHDGYNVSDYRLGSSVNIP